MADDFDLDAILDDALDNLNRAEEEDQVSAPKPPPKTTEPAAAAAGSTPESREPEVKEAGEGSAPALRPQSSEPPNFDPGAAEFRKQMGQFMKLLQTDPPEGKEDDPNAVPKLEDLLKSVLTPPGADPGEEGSSSGDPAFNMDALLKSVLDASPNPTQNGPHSNLEPEAKPPEATGDIIQDALNMMSHGREKLKEDKNLAGGEEEVLMNLLKGLGSFDPSNPETLDSALSGIMDEMFTKEVLEEPVNRVATAFPEWIEQNKEKLSSEDLTRYKKQCETFQEVAKLLGTEDPDMKAVREKIDDMMDDGELPTELRQKMFGDIDPSKLLGGDLGAGLFENDAEEMKKLMEDPQMKKAMEGCPVQ